MSKKKQKSGISELMWVDPKTLGSNPRNWKKHPHRQRQALNASLDEDGWAGAALYNTNTKRLIDGHMRKEEAIRRGEKSMPVLVGWWTQEQENRILATFDPIGALAETQADALRDLTESVNQQLDDVKGKQKAILKKLTTDIDNYAMDVAGGDAPSVLLQRKTDRREYDRARQVADENDDEDNSSVETTELRDDPVFSSKSNHFGIPDLLPDLLCKEVPTSVWDRSDDSVKPNAWYCYSAGPGTLPVSDDRDGGFLGFFTEDFRFERAWNDTPAFTEWLRSMDWRGVVQPDFSTYTDWPLPVKLHNLYRSRWCARYFQEAGIPVIPIVQSLGACPGLDSKGHTGHTVNSISTAACIHSLPKKLPVLATEARNSQGKEDYWIGWSHLHKYVITVLQPKHLVIYGGLENQKRFMSRLGKVGKTEIVLLSSFISRRRKGQK